MATNFRKKKLMGSVLGGPTSADDVGLSFYAPLTDLGLGSVNTALARGVGSPTFTRASTATTLNSLGIIINVSTGVARSCYSPTGVYLGYLAEEARTNICLQSATFDNAVWVKTACSVTADTGGADPAGAGNADKFIPDNLSSGNASRLNQSFTVTASVPQIFSIWMKAAGQTTVSLTAQGAWAVVETGDLTFTLSGNGSVASSGTKTGTITAYPNGWYRCTMLVTSTATPGTGGIQIMQAAALTGDGVNGVLLFGAQCEDGKSFPTSYIPTVAATVTRNADVLSYPTAGNMIGTNGASYAELTYSQVATDVLSTFTGVTAILMNLAGGGNVALFDGASRLVPCSLPTSATAVTKVLTTWRAATLQCNAAQNGTLGTPQTFDGDMNIDTTLNIMQRQGGTAGSFPNGTVKNVKVWNRPFNDLDLVVNTR